MAGSNSIDFVWEGSNSMDSSTVNAMGVIRVLVVRLGKVLTVPVLGKSFFNCFSGGRVLISTSFFPDGICKVSSSSESVDETHTSPEEVGVSSFFPEITSIRLPVSSNPGHVVSN